jgi:hypothetical protein
MPILKFPSVISKPLDLDRNENRKFTKNSKFENINFKKQLLKDSGMFDEKGVYHSDFSNGLLDAMYQAYNCHTPLVVTPDNLWLTILASLMKYVDNNSTRLRPHFVKFEGKKELVISSGGAFKNADMQWFSEKFSEAINENMKDSTVVEWLQCNFSTTDDRSKAVSNFMMMSGFQAYFSYKCTFLCGIPEVHIEGELEDYLNIKNKISKIRMLDDCILNDWVDRLDYVVDNFILSFSECKLAELEKFWGSTFDQEKIWGSGGDSYINGWVTILSPFFFKEKENQMMYHFETIKSLTKFPRVNITNLGSGYVRVPIEIDDNGHIFNTFVYSGQFGYTVDEKSRIGTRADWFMIGNEKENKSKPKIIIFD